MAGCASVPPEPISNLDVLHDKTLVYVTGYLQAPELAGYDLFYLCPDPSSEDLKDCIDLGVPADRAASYRKFEGSLVVARGKFYAYGPNLIVTGYSYSDIGMIDVSSIQRRESAR